MPIPHARSEFELIKQLGATAQNGGGMNSGIYLVKHKKTKKLYIEKRIDPHHIKNGCAAREVSAMIQFHSYPYIIRYKSHDLDYRKLGYGSIFMQRCELGSLEDLIRRYQAKKEYLADEGFLWKVLFDGSLAICYMNTGADVKTARRRAGKGQNVKLVAGWNPRIHRDIKPGNLFVSDDDVPGADKAQFPTIIFGDFGISTSYEDIASGRSKQHAHSGCTPAFAPPESPKYNERGDIYMLGLVIHCLARMSTTPDLKHHSALSTRYKDENLRNVVKECLLSDPAKRPAPENLPAVVWKGYREWRKEKGNDGKKLPKWALPSKGS